MAGSKTFSSPSDPTTGTVQAEPMPSSPSPPSISTAPRDAIVIGGGAAGFFSAITCAETLGGAGDVLILEQAGKVLEKVRISGGGRCNVTHDCLDPRPLTQHYPRGQKALLGSFHRFGPADTITWFESRGVRLKVEEDGRMFPVTNDSQTIIDCLQQSARRAGVDVLTGERVTKITALPGEAGFEVHTKRNRFQARSVLLATGGTRAKQGADFAAAFGHTLEPPVPSLFTFHIDDPRLRPLPGLCVTDTRISVVDHKLKSEGPTLITHWGLSGPGILKLSAWGARLLSGLDYQFRILMDWLPSVKHLDDLEAIFEGYRRERGAKTVARRSPFEPIPKRLWHELVRAAGISEALTWSRMPAEKRRNLAAQLKAGTFEVAGKSLNKEEFVTCGGVCLDEIDLRSMESKKKPGLFFAGEIMDVDGVTGGFNFQNAWTSGHIAGGNMAKRAV